MMGYRVTVVDVNIAGVFLVRKLLHKSKLRVQDYELVRMVVMVEGDYCFCCV